MEHGNSQPDETEVQRAQPRETSFAHRRSLKRSAIFQLPSSRAASLPKVLSKMFESWPMDLGDDPDVASMILEDFLQRRKRGAEPSLDEYLARYPQHEKSLVAMFSLRSMVEPGAGSSQMLKLPDVDDEIFGFRLRYPLGRGAFARVFLAEQANLASRPVVLKISAIEGNEPQTLAQLQHTSIVPIYSVHEDARAGLRAVCMPFFGGASLTSVLQELWSRAPLPLHGNEFLEALRVAQAPAARASQGQNPTVDPSSALPPCLSAEGQTPLAVLGSLNYFQTVAWIAAQLADGLQHAHNRGILHRDIKPSNILISCEGQPLLLDFNLAQMQQFDSGQASLGGTIAYMAPEHLRAMIARGPAQDVDRRSDLYFLGIVLGEMLVGGSPFDQSAGYSVVPLQIEAMAVERSKAAPSVRQLRVDVPWNLESIARKCLAPDPANRYQEAEQLAEDLRRYLDDRPLLYAPELSRCEQIRKYLRRHPRIAAAGPLAIVATLFVLVLGTLLMGTGKHLAQARSRLSLTGARERKQTHDAGMRRSRCLINTVIGLADNLSQGIDECEKTLALYEVPGKPGAEHPDLAYLSIQERRQLAEDRRELLLLLVGARVRRAHGDRDVVRRSLALVERANAISDLPPSRALCEERAYFLGLLGEHEKAEAAHRHALHMPALDARDHYLLATALARQGTPEAMTQAIAELNLALRINPRDYWSSVQRGICQLELGNLVAAAGDFGNCIGLWPEFPWGYFNRGCALDRGGRKAEAIVDYSEALHRDPGFVPAHVNRGLALLELKRHAAALADFDSAREQGSDEPSIEVGRAMALEGLGRSQEADESFQAAMAQADSLSASARLRLIWTYGFAIADHRPAKAQEMFEAVLRRDSRQPQALYGLAMLAMSQGRNEAALRLFDRALEANPGLVEVRRYRAVLRARTGDWARAGEDINRCLERDSTDGSTLYVAACVASLASRTLSSVKAADQAIELLEKAVARGVDPAKAATDPDLAALQAHPRFRRLLAGRSSRPPGASTTVQPREHARDGNERP